MTEDESYYAIKCFVAAYLDRLGKYLRFEHGFAAGRMMPTCNLLLAKEVHEIQSHSPALRIGQAQNFCPHPSCSQQGAAHSQQAKKNKAQPFLYEQVYGHHCANAECSLVNPFMGLSADPVQVPEMRICL